MHHRFPFSVTHFPSPVLFSRKEGKNLRFSSLAHFSSFLLHLQLYCESLTYFLNTYLPVLLLIAKGYRELHRLGEVGERRIA